MRIPEELIFISAQPHDPYFQWQHEVLITNFREFGISHRMEVLVFYPREGLHPGWEKLKEKYKEVKFFFYPDEGLDVDLYIPILRPFVLGKHFEAHSERLAGKTFFYHDSDIIFNFLPDFEKLCAGEICWQSDTSGYLDYAYLQRKEIEGKIEDNLVIKGLAAIGGITLELIQSYTGKTGGAQYILKGIDSDFWKEVEKDCLSIRRYLMIDINQKYFASENAGFQSWCSDMWAVNFNLWKRGKVTDVTPELDFSWATDHIDTYTKKPIYHNAGATSLSQNLFYKGNWINSSPIGKAHVVSKNFASYKYVQAIQKVR